MIVNILSLSISLLTCLLTFIILRNIKKHLYYILNKPSKETIDCFVYKQKEIELPMFLSSSNDVLKIENNYLRTKGNELFLCINYDNFKGYNCFYLWIDSDKQFKKIKTKILNLYPKKKYIVKNKQIIPYDIINTKEKSNFIIPTSNNKKAIEISYIQFLLEKIEKTIDKNNTDMIEDFNNIKQDLDTTKDYDKVKENINSYIKKYNIILQ